MFYLTIVNKILCHCHSWLAGQYNGIIIVTIPCCPFRYLIEFSIEERLVRKYSQTMHVTKEMSYAYSSGSLTVATYVSYC